MTVTASSAPAKRRPRSATKESGSGRSGAASRAYERRQQRASARGSAAVSAGQQTGRGPLSATTITARIPFVALIIGLLSLGLGLTLLLTTRSAEDSYILSEAKEYNQRLAQESASLQRDVELADSAPELARKAAELGMIPAANTARLLVAEDGSVHVVGTPEPAQGTPVAPLDPPESETLASSSSALESSSAAQAPSSSVGGSVSSRTDLQASPSRASSVPSTTPATPNTSNDAGTVEAGEQLVPMSIPSASPSGSQQ